MMAYERGRRDETAGGAPRRIGSSRVAARVRRKGNVPPISRGHAPTIPD